MSGSAAQPYVLKNTGGVYSCSCPAWRNQGAAIERRTCKHLRRLRGDAAEDARVGGPGGSGAQGSVRAARAASGGGAAGGAAGTAEAKAPPVLLAQSWSDEVDIDGWWMSEKLDGVRAWWDGKGFWSRLGNPYHAPEWFTAGLPERPLDGELWMGRKLFQRTVGTVRRQDRSEHWRDVRFLVFDAPDDASTFEDRIGRIPALLETAPYANAHPHVRCVDIKQLIDELDRVCALGGEGLMLRQPGSRYEAGRSSSLLKVKRFLDGEARVIGHLPGAGKHTGRLGALAVALDDGTRFSVGTGFSDREREDPPAVGTLISFRYQELTDGGVPRFPAFVGVREDVAGAPALTPKRVPAPAGGAQPSAGRSSAHLEAVGTFPARLTGEGTFWEVTIDGTAVNRRGGRVGTRGQVKIERFESVELAIAAAESFVREKRSRGYVPAPAGS